LTGIAKDANSTRDAGHFPSTKRLAPSMKYAEYVVKTTETVISLEVQFKRHFFESRVHSSATVSLFD